MGFLATINVPGYLPMDDEPPVFDTAGEAWAYLESERERDECDATEDGIFVASECLTELRRLAEAGQSGSIFVPEVGEGVVYGDTPGSGSPHDLGLAYCVTCVPDNEGEVS